MKNFIVIFFLFVISTNSYAQNKLKEADFIGNVRFLKADSSTINLERTNVQMKTKATGSKMWLGIGSSKAFVEVPGKSAKNRFSSNSVIKFIVRVADNDLDPMSIVSLFEYNI